MKISRIPRFALVPALSLAFYAGCSASSTPGTDGTDNGTGTGGSGSTGDIGDLDGAVDGGDGTGTYVPVEWPADPVIDTGAPANSADLFAGAAGSPVCVLEPQDGSMLPKNWLRPRFNVKPAGGENLFEIKLTSDQADGKTLTIYTTNPEYAMDGGYFAWIGQKATTAPVKVNVSIRSTTQAGGAVGTATSSFVIAPVIANGTMVYWASKQSGDLPENSRLEGFRVGDEATLTALTPLDVQESDLRLENYAVKDARGNAGAGKASCIGCHTATPDGTAAVFNDGWPWSGISASIEDGSKGARGNGVSAMGARLMQMPFIGTFSFSEAQWSDAKKLGVATLSGDYSAGVWAGNARNVAAVGDLIWIDLAASGDPSTWTDFSSASSGVTTAMGTGWGKLARTGDSRAPANPSWSPDGSTVAYTSVAQVAGGHAGGLQAAPTTCGDARDCPSTGATEADIYTVPFADGAGGNATPLSGAAAAGVAEYYADWSNDGKFIAFNRDASTVGYIYYRPNAEINVIPAAGGTPHRLAANDPPACTGEASPGVINSWPKWSPGSAAANGVTYYWLVFSSARQYKESFQVPKDAYTPSALDSRSSQLYLAAVAVAADGTITSYPGTYIWNQTKDTSNLTPAWKGFKIPPVPVTK